MRRSTLSCRLEAALLTAAATSLCMLGGAAAQGPVRFEVGLHGQQAPGESRYYVVTEDPSLIQLCREQLALPESERRLHVNGALAPTNGGFNPPWSWHLLPEDWALVSVSIELCDGTPKMVEEDLSTWLNDIGRFCAWGSYILREMDQVSATSIAWGTLKARYR